MVSWKLDVANTFTPGERSYSLPNKLLVTAGPTNCSPRVISALTQYSTTPVCKEMFQVKKLFLNLFFFNYVNNV